VERNPAACRTPHQGRLIVRCNIARTQVRRRYCGRMGLAFVRAVGYSSGVRCGSLAAGMMRHDPRVCFGGAAWSAVSYPLFDCPAKGQPLQSAFGGFSLAARNWTTLHERRAQNGSRGLMGVSVMWQPDRSPSKGAERATSQAPLDRLGRCSDAAAPGGREAGQSDRVSFASPLNCSPRGKPWNTR
jgi:hypothetical protein